MHTISDCGVGGFELLIGQFVPRKAVNTPALPVSMMFGRDRSRALMELIIGGGESGSNEGRICYHHLFFWCACVKK